MKPAPLSPAEQERRRVLEAMIAKLNPLLREPWSASRGFDLDIFSGACSPEYISIRPSVEHLRTIKQGERVATYRTLEKVASSIIRSQLRTLDCLLDWEIWLDGFEIRCSPPRRVATTRVRSMSPVGFSQLELGRAFREKCKGTNFITPVVVAYRLAGAADEYVVELSSGDFLGKMLYGVTVVQVELQRGLELRGIKKCDDLCKCFNSIADALAYTGSL